ncbi:uncharacterized protein isoform X2 [Rhodnius prolixus]|uniref:uncharacterized protein isoform X2 n=1 Tax=Rhodnius prolixus TaxID=13249 RepID=UPI003D18D5EE
MEKEATVVYKRERSPIHNKDTFYLPHKKGGEDFLYIHIDDPPLDLSRRNRRVEEEVQEDVVAVDSPVILTSSDFSSAYKGFSHTITTATVGRKGATPAVGPGAAKMYKCCECDYVSKRSYDVRRHMKTHGNTRPYGCPQCAHTARDAGSLRSHMLQRHGNLDQYVCPRCDYSSNRQADLARHIRTYHEPRDVKIFHWKNKAVYFRFILLEK